MAAQPERIRGTKSGQPGARRCQFITGWAAAGVLPLIADTGSAIPAPHASRSSRLLGRLFQWPPSRSLQPWSPQPGGFNRVAAAGATLFRWCRCCSSAPSSSSCHRQAGRAVRFLTHLTVLGSMGLTSQLLLVLRGYRKPLSNQPQLALLVSAVAMLVLCWLVPPRWGCGWPTAATWRWASASSCWRCAKAVRGTPRGLDLGGGRFAGHHQPGHARLDLGARRHDAIGRRAGRAVFRKPTSGSWAGPCGCATPMRWSSSRCWPRAPASTRSPGCPRTPMPGGWWGSFLRSGSAQSLGVVAVTLANPGHAGGTVRARRLQPCALRLGGPAAALHALGAQLGRLGDDGFLVLVRTEDPNS